MLWRTHWTGWVCRRDVRSGASTLDEAQVQAYVRAELARYEVPRDVVFVDELPRNPTGKVLKRTLVEREDNR